MSKGSLGQMLCWLETERPSRAEHQLIKSANHVLTFERRRSWREWAAATIPDVLAAEREQRGGDGSEPQRAS